MDGLAVDYRPEALGDSITDGFGSTVDANRRWPDFLAERLRARHGGKPISVVDQGISGNRIPDVDLPRSGDEAAAEVVDPRISVPPIGRSR